VCAHPVGVAVDVEHDAAVQEPVEHRGGSLAVRRIEAGETGLSVWTTLITQRLAGGSAPHVSEFSSRVVRHRD
jgi:hypothetical protein